MFAWKKKLDIYALFYIILHNLQDHSWIISVKPYKNDDFLRSKNLIIKQNFYNV